MLRERSPTPEPPVNAGAEVFEVNSAAPARGRRKSRRGRGYALMLRERSPTPDPSVNAGAEVFGVNSAAPARGRRKSRRGRGYAPIAPRAFADPRASGHTWVTGLWGQLSSTGSGAAKVASRARIRPNGSASVRRPPSLVGKRGAALASSSKLSACRFSSFPCKQSVQSRFELAM